MQVLIHSAEDLGLAIRAARKSAQLRQDDLAGTAQVSRQFAFDVERGKPTVQLGRVLRLLQELGVPLSVELDPQAYDSLQRLRDKRRARQAAAAPGPEAGTPGA